MRARTGMRTLAVNVGEDGALPTEFRLFVKGVNDTENGEYLFDDAAAEQVMAAWRAWGVDLMIDLEHQALESGAPVEPNARDARGWCRLELRDDGSLWAVGVSWTEDGAARLREKRQRYISPAFAVDAENRVTSIINIAITAIPATHGTPALVAARRGTRDARKLTTGYSFSDVQNALSSVLYERFPPADEYSCGPWIVDVFDALVVFQNDGALFEIAYTFDGSTATLGGDAVPVQRSYTPIEAPSAPATPTPAPAPSAPPVAARIRKPAAKLAAAGKETKMDTKTTQAALEAVANKDQKSALVVLQQILAEMLGTSMSGGDDQAPDPGAGGGDGGSGDATDDTVAAARVAMALTGIKDPIEALAELSRRNRFAVEIGEREAKLSADRASIEATERRSLIGKLVQLGVEIPATAWSDDKGTVPCERLAKEPLDDLRGRVAKLSNARGSGASASSVLLNNITPPAGKPGEAGLDERELAICKEYGCEPAMFARLKTERRAAGAAKEGV